MFAPPDQRTICARRFGMHALKHHLAHHRMHVLGCGAGILLLALGEALDAPVIAIGGAVICGASCLDMVRMMVGRPKRS